MREILNTQIENLKTEITEIKETIKTDDASLKAENNKANKDKKEIDKLKNNLKINNISLNEKEKLKSEKENKIKASTTENIELIYNNIFEEEKIFNLNCLLNLQKNGIYLFVRASSSFDFDNKFLTITMQDNNKKDSKLPSKLHKIILFEGENFDGNFVIINRTGTGDIVNSNADLKINDKDFKSLKIVTDKFFKDNYLQNMADKNNEILLFTKANYLGKCYRIKLQPNEIILDENNKNSKKEIIKFRNFFTNKKINSIILPGNTKDQNHRTFRNILLIITFIDSANKKDELIVQNLVNGNDKLKIDNIGTYKIEARYSYLDTKMADKILLQNQQQLNKLNYELNTKLKEKIEKQATLEEKEEGIINNMSDRIFNEITKNINKMNYIKNN